MPIHLVPILPLPDGAAGEFTAVVADDNLGLPLSQIIDAAHELSAGQRAKYQP